MVGALGNVHVEWFGFVGAVLIGIRPAWSYIRPAVVESHRSDFVVTGAPRRPPIANLTRNFWKVMVFRLNEGMFWSFWSPSFGHPPVTCAKRTFLHSFRLALCRAGGQATSALDAESEGMVQEAWKFICCKLSS